MIRLTTASAYAIGLSALLGISHAAAQTPRPQEPAQPPAATQPPRPGDAKQPAAAQEGVSAADRAFATKAAEGGHKEVALAKLAQQKGSSDEVKGYAQTLERDHSEANDELKAWASQKNVTLPPAPPHGKAGNAKLEGLSGAAFDKAYISAMVADHKKDIAAFEKQAKSGTDADLKALVLKTLPTLKGHLEQAQKIQSTLGGARPSS